MRNIQILGKGMDEDLSAKKRLNSFFVEEVNSFLQVARLNNNREIALKSVGHTILWACPLDEFYKKSYLNYDTC